jgi:hypothetical protein
MEELKQLLEMFASVPNIALYGLLAFLFYKLSAIASVFALVRLMIVKLHDWSVRRKTEAIELTLDGVTFDSVSGREAFLTQLRRLRYIGDPDRGARHYVYGHYGVRDLEAAIDTLYEAHERKKAQKEFDEILKKKEAKDAEKV